jgi:HlyD family secretion protein
MDPAAPAFGLEAQAMAIPDKKLFRKEALDRFSSPDDLERLMPVAREMDWLIIVTTGLLLAWLAGWSVVGRIPTLATGRGVILRPRHLMQVQTTVAGQILDLKVRVGDHVREGELIATTDQSVIVKRIEENRRNLATLEDQNRRRTAAAQLQTEMQAE